jgi:predicted regulator of Ras-like GTPase activity (Roadblock/LC7/MglB family)
MGGPNTNWESVMDHPALAPRPKRRWFRRNDETDAPPPELADAPPPGTDPFAAAPPPDFAPPFPAPTSYSPDATVTLPAAEPSPAAFDVPPPPPATWAPPDASTIWEPIPLEPPAAADEPFDVPAATGSRAQAEPAPPPAPAPGESIWSFPSLTEPSAASEGATSIWSSEPPAPPARPVEDTWAPPVPPVPSATPAPPAPPNGAASWVPPVPEPPPVSGSTSSGPTRTWFEDLWSTSPSDTSPSDTSPSVSEESAAAEAPAPFADEAGAPAVADAPEPISSAPVYDADAAAYSGTNGAGTSTSSLPSWLPPLDEVAAPEPAAAPAASAFTVDELWQAVPTAAADDQDAPVWDAAAAFAAPAEEPSADEPAAAAVESAVPAWSDTETPAEAQAEAATEAEPAPAALAEPPGAWTPAPPELTPPEYDVAALLAASAAWATPTPEEPTAEPVGEGDEPSRAPVPLGEAYPHVTGDATDGADEAASATWALASDASVTWSAEDVAAADELAVTEPIPVVDVTAPAADPGILEPPLEAPVAAAAAEVAAPEVAAPEADITEADVTGATEAEVAPEAEPAVAEAAPTAPAVEPIFAGPSASPAWAAEMDADPELAEVRAGLQEMLAELSTNVPDIAGAVLATRDGLPLAATIDDADVERIAAMTASVLGLSRRAVAVLDHGELWDTVLRFQNAYLLVYPAGRPAALCVAARSWRNIGLVDHEARRAAARFASLVAAEAEDDPSGPEGPATSSTATPTHPTTDPVT